MTCHLTQHLLKWPWPAPVVKHRENLIFSWSHTQVIYFHGVPNGDTGEISNVVAVASAQRDSDPRDSDLIDESDFSVARTSRWSLGEFQKCGLRLQLYVCAPWYYYICITNKSLLCRLMDTLALYFKLHIICLKTMILTCMHIVSHIVNLPYKLFKLTTCSLRVYRLSLELPCIDPLSLPSLQTSLRVSSSSRRNHIWNACIKGAERNDARIKFFLVKDFKPGFARSANSARSTY